MALGGVNKRRPNLVSFGGEQTVDREEKKRDEEEEEEKKKRREEEGEKFKQGQKGMELYGISKVLNGFPCNCMVIILPKPRVC